MSKSESIITVADYLSEINLWTTYDRQDYMQRVKSDGALEL